MHAAVFSTHRATNSILAECIYGFQSPQHLNVVFVVSPVSILLFFVILVVFDARTFANDQQRSPTYQMNATYEAFYALHA